jgi:hypothetical protein
MSEISVELITYSISSGDVATVESCADCFSVLPRNFVPFAGKLVRVTVLQAIDIPSSINAILIPRSIRRIYRNVFSLRSIPTSLAFELGSELEWIGRSAFESCGLRCIFIPQSVDFIGSDAFSGCQSVEYV